MHFTSSAMIGINNVAVAVLLVISVAIATAMVMTRLMSQGSVPRKVDSCSPNQSDNPEN